MGFFRKTMTRLTKDLKACYRRVVFVYLGGLDEEKGFRSVGWFPGRPRPSSWTASCWQRR